MDYEDYNGQGHWAAQSANPAMSIIGAEDEDFENDLDPMVDDSCTTFNSMELLKSRPTHLLVFLQHVMLQFDCAPVLCYLHADLFRNLSAKETKKLFVDFYNNFLDKGAILRVSVPPHISYELDRTRADLIPDEQQKRFAQEVQSVQVPELARQLEDFRQKRMMGMTPNELELQEVENHHSTDRIPTEMKEKAVGEKLLDAMAEMHPTIVADEEKCTAIFSAVLYYMKHLGVKTRATDSKKSRGFFRKKDKKEKKEEPKVSKPRTVLPSILREAESWMRGGGGDIKPPRLDNEGDKDKSHERKGSSGNAPSRGLAPDNSAASLSGSRKSGSTGSNSQASSDISEASTINISVIPSPDSIGPTSSRSDSQSVSEGGEVSPASQPGAFPWDAAGTSPSETAVEEAQDKDRDVKRSTSMRVERRPSSRRRSGRQKQSRSRSDVDLQTAAVSPATSPPPSPSPRPRLFTDGSLPVPEVAPAGSASGPSPQLMEEMEPRLLELEQDPPNWREQADPRELKELNKKETKRQEVINELFMTEHAHVRMLNVLQNIFARPMEREGLMHPDEVAAIFPGLDDIIELHNTFYENLKKLRLEDNYIVKSISSTLLSRFSGPDGEFFQKLSARFCSHQSWALEQIKSKKKDPRFNTFIQEAESRPQCRRLQLKDIIPIEMQRLTKYPLLLENVAKSTEKEEEKHSIQQVAEACRKILNHVNEEVKSMENLLTLKDYQRRLDTSGLKPSNELYMEYKSIDLTTRKMLYEGPLIWRVTKEKALDVQCVLLGDLLVLLQKQDDKMLLKCQSKSNVVQEGKQMLSPIIKLESAFLREVATDRKAFYVIFTWESGAQIYELVAQSMQERKSWHDMIKSAVDDFKTSGGGSALERARFGSIIPGSPAVPLSPSTLQPPLSPTENGDSSKISGDGEKDLSAHDKSGDVHAMLMDYLSAHGYDPIGHCNSPQEKMADHMIDELMSLKRLLVGSISLSEDSHVDGENGGAEPEGQDEIDGRQSAVDGEEPVADGEKEDGGSESGGDGGAKGEGEEKQQQQGEQEHEEEQGGISAPMVLSQERLEEVRHRLELMEDKLRKLQSVEESYHKLQELLAKFSLERGNY
ncbi:rho guanine nucleotide exchange factor 1b isoform X3 [Engraulis encrasicolus]|uniref:rho guanine nucleotide exchange factor 1b isoform X3 n=1 Tax=Engraulis encrasicolus TaxID=184585 RepID=UPI002FD71C3B